MEKKAYGAVSFVNYLFHNTSCTRYALFQNAIINKSSKVVFIGDVRSLVGTTGYSELRMD